jgi:serine/threonine protein phosphatase 1
MVFKRLFGRKDKVETRVWQVPAGKRLYAIGDIHGRLDLLDILLDKIAADDAARGPAHTKLIFLGDLADRGPDSAGVVARLMALSQSQLDCVFLAGNHEELMIGVWDGQMRLASTFHRAGGRATLISYGVAPDDYDQWDFEQLTEATARHIPADHIAFMKGFVDQHREGDYLFVHAGIRPGVALEEQDAADLRWIRGEFVRSEVDHGLMVIHGHTITEDVDERPNRIGIDTGAFQSGKLTAIGLEGGERWYLQS